MFNKQSWQDFSFITFKNGSRKGTKFKHNFDIVSNAQIFRHFKCLQYSHTFWNETTQILWCKFTKVTCSFNFSKKVTWLCNVLLPSTADGELKTEFLRNSTVMAKQTVQIPLNSTELLVSVIINHSDGKVSVAWIKRTAGDLVGDSHPTCRLAPQPTVQTRKSLECSGTDSAGAYWWTVI